MLCGSGNGGVGWQSALHAVPADRRDPCDNATPEDICAPRGGGGCWLYLPTVVGDRSEIIFYSVNQFGIRATQFLDLAPLP